MKITLWTILAIVAAVAILEAAGRLYIAALYGIPGRSYGIYRSDPVLGARLRENSYNLLKEFNNFGFQSRRDVTERAAPGVLRIITYGGSTTFCYNLSVEDSWPSRLEAILRARRSAPVEVLNAGDVLWSLAHALARARTDLPSLRPDYVVLYSGINEMANARALVAEGIDLSAIPAEQRVGLFNRSAPKNDPLFRISLVYKAWQHYVHMPFVQPLLSGLALRLGDTPADRGPGPAFEAAVLDHYRRTLEAFIGFAHENGARVVFVVQAAHPGDERALRLARYSRAGAETARRLGAVVVDAQEIIGGGVDPGALFIASGMHVTAAGAESLAGLIADSVDWTAR